MEIFRSGRWSVIPEGIRWDGHPAFIIHKENIGEQGARESSSKMHEWLIRPVHKTWLTKDDIYTLNTAYIFALEYFKMGFSQDISFVRTFLEQKKLLDEKQEEPESDEITLGGGD